MELNKKKVSIFFIIYVLLIALVMYMGIDRITVLIALFLSPVVFFASGKILKGFLYDGKKKKLESWSGQRYAERIFENSSNLLFLVDRGGNVLRRNKVSTEVLGRDGRDNLNLAEIVHPDDLDLVKDELNRVFEEGRVRGLDLRLVPETGKSKLNKQPIPSRMNGSSITDYACILEFIDRTDISNLQRKLRESTARYRYLIEDAIDTLDSGVVLIDKNDQVVWLNETMEDFFDLDREYLIGNLAGKAHKLFVRSFKHPEEFLSITEEAIEKQDRIGSHTCYLEEEDREKGRVLEYRSIPIETERYKGGRIEHFIDITEVKKLESDLREKTERLKKSNEKLEEFSRGISHDLKAPLQTIEGYCQMIKQDLGEKLDGSSNLLVGLSKTSQRLRDRIEGLLSYSRIDLEKNSFEQVDLNKIIEELEEDLGSILKGVKLEVSEELPKVYGNRTLLIELFNNLFSNAVKYNKGDEPRIVIDWEDRGEEYLVKFSDNGPGIKERYLEKIFQVFEKLNPREDPEGIGIGLALCKRIIDEHGGEIWAESDLGEGTTFLFTLPAESPITENFPSQEKESEEQESLKTKSR